jgi:hypothetical protein
MVIKNQTEKGEKIIKHKAKSKKGKKNFDKKAIKEEPKIKVLTHELLAFTLSYLMLAPW